MKSVDVTELAKTVEKLKKDCEFAWQAARNALDENEALRRRVTSLESLVAGLRRNQN